MCANDLAALPPTPLKRADTFGTLAPSQIFALMQQKFIFARYKTQFNHCPEACTLQYRAHHKVLDSGASEGQNFPLLSRLAVVTADNGTPPPSLVESACGPL